VAIAQMRTFECATSAAARSISSSKLTDKKVMSRLKNNNSVQLSFMPPVIMTTLKNEDEQRIIEVCIRLKSGVEFNDVSVFVMTVSSYIAILLWML